MDKIDVLELLDEQSVTKKDQDYKDWRETLEEIKVANNNFDINTMCELCIKQQYEHGLKDTLGRHQPITIQCTGLNTYKNKVVSEHGEEVYNTLEGIMTTEQLAQAEQIENSMSWMEGNINDAKLFNSRPHQVMINSCSAKKKVLRMGRRCIESTTKVLGPKKGYSIKHLFNMFRKYKEMPYIYAYDDETGKLVLTNKYLIMPNGRVDVLKLTLSNGHSVIATDNHPLLVYRDKQFNYVPIGELNPEYDKILLDNNDIVSIRSIEKIGKRSTYHLSVVKYETFLTTGGFIHHNTGKCLTLSTEIPTPDGWKTMGDIKVGDKVFDENGKPCNVTFATAPMFEKDCYKITFSDNTTVDCDYSHLWSVTTVSSRRYDNQLKQEQRTFTLDTETLFQDFKEKIYGVKLTKPVEYSEKTLTVDPYVLGYWLGDGSTNSSSFTVGDEDKEETTKLFEERGYILKKNKSKLNYSVVGLLTELKKIGTGDVKRIPSTYLQASVSQRFELLKGLLDSDGGINDRDRDIEFSSCFEELAYQVYELICSLGIKATIAKNKSYLNGENKKDRYRILFKTNYEVFNLSRKLTKQVLEVGEKVKSRYNTRFIKNIERIKSEPVKCIEVDSPNSLFLITRSYIPTHNTYAMSVGMLHRMLTNKNYKVLMVAPMATMIDEVVEQIKKFCDAMEVNPIEAASQSPIAFIEFSTGSTFKGVTAGASGAKGTRGKAADLLYIDECFPGRTKIKMWDGSTKSIEDIEIGDRVLSFDERTQKLVVKTVLEVRCTGKKDVYSFETVSGKKLHTTANHPVWSREGWKEAYETRSLATTETRTGDFFFESVIGSRFKATEKVYNLEVEDTHTYIADGFIVHNCDFLNPKDLNSILGVLLDNEGTEFWASSTPIGEGNLYQLSQDPSFKEFHFPSYVIPHYSDKIDADLRRQMTEVGYEQEVLANFGASEEGVFQIPFIERSIIKEQLILTERYILENRPDFILFMGVDWNHDKVGTRIVVLAYHKPTGRFVVVCKERVALAGWTQLLAVQKIVDLNRIYDVDHIYVDEGFGTSQASMLRQFSREQYGKVPANHPDLKLTDVVAVNFSATLNLRDPVTGEELKKQTKQYMVEHAAKLLTQGVLILREEEDSAIIAQMKNYVVKSVSARGLRTFTYKDPQVADHDLDAYMLALHGFHQEYSEFNTYGPIVGIGSLLSRNNDGSLHMNDLGMDPVEVYSASSNMVINTRKSILTNKFSESSRHSPFKGRKKW